MVGLSRIGHFDRSSLAALADWAAVAVAMALPWSTSAVGIAIAVWLVVLLPTLDAGSVKRELVTAVGGLPVVMCCLGVIGMLWADVSWHDRFAGLDSFFRLLAIPLLLAQFRRSENGIWVVRGFFISSIALLIASYAIAFALGDKWRGVYGVPVHDTIFQGSVFLICGFGALGYAALARGKGAGSWPIAIFATGALFLINFAFVVTESHRSFHRAPAAVAARLALVSMEGNFGRRIACSPGGKRNVDRLVGTARPRREIHRRDAGISRCRQGDFHRSARRIFKGVPDDNRFGPNHRSRHRLDSGRISSRHSRKNGRIGRAYRKSAQSDLRRCYSAGTHRRRRTMGHVDCAPCFVPRAECRRVARLDRGCGECLILDRALSLV